MHKKLCSCLTKKGYNLPCTAKPPGTWERTEAIMQNLRFALLHVIQHARPTCNRHRGAHPHDARRRAVRQRHIHRPQAAPGAHHARVPFGTPRAAPAAGCARGVPARRQLPPRPRLHQQPHDGQAVCGRRQVHLRMRSVHHLGNSVLELGPRSCPHAGRRGVQQTHAGISAHKQRRLHDMRGGLGMRLNSSHLPEKHICSTELCITMTSCLRLQCASIDPQHATSVTPKAEPKAQTRMAAAPARHRRERAASVLPARRAEWGRRRPRARSCPRRLPAAQTRRPRARA